MIGSSLCVGTLIHQPARASRAPLRLPALHAAPRPRRAPRARSAPAALRPQPLGARSPFATATISATTRGPLRDKVEAFLRGQGIEPPGGRILLLTHPAVFGYVFNPVSFFYCYDAAGRLVARVAEVNNTFGDRHAYAGDRAGLAGQEGHARLAVLLHGRQLPAGTCPSPTRRGWRHAST